MKKIITISAMVMLCHLCFSQGVKSAMSEEQPSANNVTFMLNAGVFGDSVVHIIWESNNGENIKNVFLETTTDGINFTTLAKAETDKLIDIHSNNYPDYIDYSNNILLSSESGTYRYIYNDVLKTKNDLKFYRVTMVSKSGDVFISKVYSPDNDNNSAFDNGNNEAENGNFNHDTKGGGSGKPGCPSLGTPPTGYTPTGQTQTFTGTCCIWTEELYTDSVSSNVIVCGGNSYAWCCNNVPGASGCASKFVSDPCCVHTCSQYNSCSCTPWNCCPSSIVQQWVVTQVTNLSPFTITANVQNASCANANDGNIIINVSNYVPPISFVWSNGANSQNLLNVSPGAYTVTITDSSGCSTDSTYTVASANNLTVTTSFQDSHCNQPDGFASVTAGGGSGSYTYLWNTGQATNAINNISAGSYTVTVSDGSCSEVHTITVGNISGPAASVAGTTSAVCGNPAGAINVNVSGGAPPYSYVWNSAPPQYTKNLVNVAPGAYCLSVTDTNNCMAVVCATITANTFPQPDICIVSVDTAVNKNLVVWEKPANTGGIDQYLIYKESSFAGVYNLIGSQSGSIISTFLDAASNPAQQANRYKLAIYDTCGNISPQSAFHETIHLTASIGVNNEVNLIWNHYIGFTFGTYNIYRGSSLSTLTLLASISGSNSSYTDLTPPAGNQYYLIEAVRPVACSPSKGISSTRSNILQLTITDIPESSISKDIRIFPNPGSGSFTISLEGAVMKDVNCTVSNALGQNVYKGILDGSSATIDLTGVAKGIYLLNLKNKNMNKIAKIVVE